MSVDVWIAGRSQTSKKKWQILGIYSEIDGAKRRCTQVGDWIARVPIDHDLDEEPTPWPEAYYVHEGRLLTPEQAIAEGWKDPEVEG